MSKESFARANNSSDLTVTPGQIHDADRLAAMATGNTLGGLLLRLRESEQPQWARRIVLILGRRINERHNLGVTVSAKVAACALQEFYSPHCATCKGARELVADNKRFVCESCNGTGKHRYDNESRRQNIGAYSRRVDEAMAYAHRCMNDALGAFLSHAAWQLRNG